MGTITREDVLEIYKQNEADKKNAYLLSPPVNGQSGVTFGRSQFDLSGSLGQEALRRLGIFTEQEILGISGNKSKITVNDLNEMNAKMSQPGMREKIEALDNAHIDSQIAKINDLCRELEKSGRKDVADHIAKDSFAQAMLIDYDNQYDLGKGGPMEAYLKTGRADKQSGKVVEAGERFDNGSIIRFLLNTKYADDEYAANKKVPDPERRIGNIGRFLEGKGEMTDYARLIEENRPAPGSGKPRSEASPIQYQDPIMLSLLMGIKNERGTILTPLPENAKRRGSSDAAKVLYPDWN